MAEHLTDVWSALMDQLTVFEQPVARARRTDPHTSHAAARSVKNLRASQWAVLNCFLADETHDEGLILRYLSEHRPPQSDSGLRTRRRELVDMGFLADTGKTNRTVGGRNTIIWAITPSGRDAAARRE